VIGGPVGDGDHYWRLHQPLDIAGCAIPNRIARTAHGTGYCHGTVSEQLISYHEARARGGVGLIFLETAGVHPSSPAAINLFGQQSVDGLALLADRVHTHGTKVFQQLWHGGPNSEARFQPLLAASSVPEPIRGRMPTPMSLTVIDDVVEAFAVAARRCKEAGLDGVEVHGAHGYLVCSFLSPATNRRQDDYGGSMANRCRFVERILRAIRNEVGADFPVGIRLSATEAMPGGLEPVETAAIARRLESQGLVDFVDVSMGSYHSYPKFIGAMHEPLGYQLPTSAPVTAAVTVPSIVAGRIMDLHDAERILADGVADMVSMVRATIADPDLVRKSFAGAEEEVRPCISCNQGCIGGVLGPSGRLGCAVNPDVGREGRPVSRARRQARRLLVVGGGPAGLEAACTAASRGHQVVLCEAATELGGQLRLARRAPHRQDIGAISDWLATRAHKLGVDIRMGDLVGRADVDALDPDVVILATGSEPSSGFSQRHRPNTVVEGAGSPHVVTATEALARGAPPPRSVFVFDDLGDIIGVSVAEYFLERGCRVTLATSHAQLAATLGGSLQRDPVAARLRAWTDFRLVTRAAVIAVNSTSVVLDDLDGGGRVEVPGDLIVVSAAAVPRRELFEELADGAWDVQLVGDALVAADLQSAITTGRRAGMAVGIR
jgi:2,4-dienoyl-CoA reductase-like NADH-dependent reductase (Old Yellow Enzyme family)